MADLDLGISPACADASPLSPLSSPLSPIPSSLSPSLFPTACRQICDIDPFTDDYFESQERCQKPIPDRVNNVEKTEFDLRHYLKCKYKNGDTVEYRSCDREGTMGILTSSGDVGRGTSYS